LHGPLCCAPLPSVVIEMESRDGQQVYPFSANTEIDRFDMDSLGFWSTRDLAKHGRNRVLIRQNPNFMEARCGEHGLKPDFQLRAFPGLAGQGRHENLHRSSTAGWM